MNARTRLYNEYRTGDNTYEQGQGTANLKRLTSALRNLNTTLPEAFSAGTTVLSQVSAMRMIEETWPGLQHFEGQLDAAAELVLTGESPEEIMMQAAASSLLPGLAQRVEIKARSKYQELINENADLIITTIRDEVFTPAMNQFKALCEEHGTYGSWNAQDAALNGEYERAILIRENDDIPRRLMLAFEARDSLHPGAFQDGLGYVRDTAAIDSLCPGLPGSLDWWAGPLALGWEPWFPTLSEWDEQRKSAPEAEDENNIFISDKKESSDSQ